MSWCKCELKTEAFVIAVFHMIGSSVSVLSHLIVITTTSRISIAEEEGEEPTGYAAANGLAGSMVSCATNALLLYGIVKENRFTIIPWLALNSIVLILGGLLLLFLPILYALIFGLFLGALFGYSWYTIWKYFRSLDPHNPNRQPQTAVYIQPQATTGFTNQQFVPDKIQQPDTVVFTPGLPAYSDIVAQPQNV